MAERKEGVEMPIFGYDTIGSKTGLWGNYIIGSKFTMPYDGIANSISCYLYEYISTGDPPNKTKCAIYRVSDGKLIGVTEEVNVDKTAKWWTFNLITQPNLYKDIEYVLVLWGEKNKIMFYDTIGYSSYYKSGAYTGNFPDPISWEQKGYAGVYSIYCTYSGIGVLNVVNTNVE
jgi:hypothetical protein